MKRFLNCKIDLSRKVFRPRIETEYLTGKAIKELKNKEINVLDVFSGTGCIGIALLKNIEKAKVDFADISKEALKEIRINLKLNKIKKERTKVIKSDLFKGLGRKKYDIVFANPPYVALERISEVDEEVLKNDPKIALFAGRTGMVYIKSFLNQIKSHLKNKGIFYLEFDPFQKKEIKEILRKKDFKISFKKDQFEKIRWLKAENI